MGKQKPCVVFPCVCLCVNTCTCVSACVCHNSVAGGIQSPPPPWEIKAISAAQDVGSEVIHTLAAGLRARGASAHRTNNNQHTGHSQRKQQGNSSFWLLKSFVMSVGRWHLWPHHKQICCEWFSSDPSPLTTVQSWKILTNDAKTKNRAPVSFLWSRTLTLWNCSV